MLAEIARMKKWKRGTIEIPCDASTIVSLKKMARSKSTLTELGPLGN